MPATGRLSADAELADAEPPAIVAEPRHSQPSFGREPFQDESNLDSGMVKQGLPWEVREGGGADLAAEQRSRVAASGGVYGCQFFFSSILLFELSWRSLT